MVEWSNDGTGDMNRVLDRLRAENERLTINNKALMSEGLRLRAALEEIAQVDPLPTRQQIIDIARRALTK